MKGSALNSRHHLTMTLIGQLPWYKRASIYLQVYWRRLRFWRVRRAWARHETTCPRCVSVILRGRDLSLLCSEGGAMLRKLGHDFRRKAVPKPSSKPGSKKTTRITH